MKQVCATKLISFGYEGRSSFETADKCTAVFDTSLKPSTSTVQKSIFDTFELKSSLGHFLAGGDDMIHTQERLSHLKLTGNSECHAAMTCFFRFAEPLIRLLPITVSYVFRSEE